MLDNKSREKNIKPGIVQPKNYIIKGYNKS